MAVSNDKISCSCFSDLPFCRLIREGLICAGYNTTKSKNKEKCEIIGYGDSGGPLLCKVWTILKRAAYLHGLFNVWVAIRREKNIPAVTAAT